MFIPVLYRVDVLLTANKPAGTYWISVGSQYRKGAPSGYGILRYSNAAAGSTPNPANIVQPDAVVDRKWSTTSECTCAGVPSRWTGACLQLLH